jgi:hypothetical protein
MVVVSATAVDPAATSTLVEVEVPAMAPAASVTVALIETLETVEPWLVICVRTGVQC